MIKVKKSEMEKLVRSAIQKTSIKKLRAYAIEDLMQEGIIILIEHLRKGYRLDVPEDHNLIYTTIKNKIIDLYRRERPRSKPVLFSVLEKEAPLNLPAKYEMEFATSDAIQAFSKSLSRIERKVLSEIINPSPKTFQIFKRSRLSQELFFKCKCGWLDKWENQKESYSDEDSLKVCILCPDCGTEVVLGGSRFIKASSGTWLTSSPKVSISSVRESLEMTIYEMDVCLVSLRSKAIQYLS